jgi:hypothetical protein
MEYAMPIAVQVALGALATDICVLMVYPLWAAAAGTWTPWTPWLTMGMTALNPPSVP